MVENSFRDSMEYSLFMNAQGIEIFKPLVLWYILKQSSFIPLSILDLLQILLFSRIGTYLGIESYSQS